MFDAAGRTVASTMRLWPALLIVAVLLNLIELVLRKWKGIVEALSRRDAVTGRISALQGGQEFVDPQSGFRDERAESSACRLPSKMLKCPNHVARP